MCGLVPSWSSAVAVTLVVFQVTVVGAGGTEDSPERNPSSSLSGVLDCSQPPPPQSTWRQTREDAPARGNGVTGGTITTTPGATEDARLSGAPQGGRTGQGLPSQ